MKEACAISYCILSAPYCHLPSYPCYLCCAEACLKQFPVADNLIVLSRKEVDLQGARAIVCMRERVHGCGHLRAQ